MKFLTDRFEEIQVPDSWRPWLFPNLRMDLCARSIWYYGRTGKLLSFRMLFVDGALCTALYRLMRTLKRCRLGPLAAIVYKLNVLLTHAVIGRNADLGPGLVILHSVGVVINSAVRSGSNLIVESCATIGAEKAKVPVLGDRVFVGSGAKIIAGVRIGDCARIGANAVVLKDIPAGATAVGVPAQVVKSG